MPNNDGGTGPRYPKPNVALIDCGSDVVEPIVSAGYNVQLGSLGEVYEFRDLISVNPVWINGIEPAGFEEQEILVADLTARSSEHPGHRVADGAEVIWTKSNGIVDPRPITAAHLSSRFDRILNNGGVAVVFLQPPENLTFTPGHTIGARVEATGSQRKLSTWGFTSALAPENVQVLRDIGVEISVESGRDALCAALSRHLRGATFTCAFQPIEYCFEDVTILAKNKFGLCVSARIVTRNGGTLILVPQLSDKSGFLLDLLANVLPESHPHLFPFAEGGKWVHGSEYELRSIKQKQDEIQHVEADAARRINVLNETIFAERESNRHLYGLVQETDSALVDSVKWALVVLGFKQVVDVDEEMRKAGTGTSLREDLQIKDRLPILIADVKGISGHPADDDALQSQKHASIRIQEWRNVDVRGLTIINHQRNLPGLERDNKMPFRQEILKAATELKVGLITGWDLYRLVRSHLRYNWKVENVQPILYRIGRIDPVPDHYQPVGVIAKVWTEAKVLSIEVNGVDFKTGDRISIEFPIEFEELVVTSLEIGKKAVRVATVGKRVGVKIQTWIESVRPGYRVFKVQPM